jgi:hypothetical protein
MPPLDDPAVLNLGDGRRDLVRHTPLLHPDRELVPRSEVVRPLDRYVTYRARAVELRMPVRIDDEREDLRSGRLHQDSPDDAFWAGVDLGHS